MLTLNALRPILPRRLGQDTAILDNLDSRNFTVVLAAILIASPVAGLRPIRAARCAFTSLPSPGTVNSPFFRVWVVAVSISKSKNAAIFPAHAANASSFQMTGLPAYRQLWADAPAVCAQVTRTAFLVTNRMMTGKTPQRQGCFRWTPIKSPALIPIDC